jgi:DNA-binding PucR family transcriptional regulator
LASTHRVPERFESRQVVLTGVSSHLRDQLVRLSRRRSTLRESPDRVSGAVIAEILRLYLAGQRTTDLAERYGVHRNTIQRVLKRHNVTLQVGPRR